MKTKNKIKNKIKYKIKIIKRNQKSIKGLKPYSIRVMSGGFKKKKLKSLSRTVTKPRCG